MLLVCNCISNSFCHFLFRPLCVLVWTDSAHASGALPLGEQNRKRMQMETVVDIPHVYKDLGMVHVKILGYAHPGKTHSSVGYNNLFIVNLSFLTILIRLARPSNGLCFDTLFSRTTLKLMFSHIR